MHLYRVRDRYQRLPGGCRYLLSPAQARREAACVRVLEEFGGRVLVEALTRLGFQPGEEFGRSEPIASEGLESLVVKASEPVAFAGVSEEVEAPPPPPPSPPPVEATDPDPQPKKRRGRPRKRKASRSISRD